MNCPRCNAPIAPNAPFCANCGFAPGAPKRGTFWAGVLITLLAAGLAILGLSLAGVIRLRAPEPVRAPVAKAQPTAPVAVQAPESKEMPADIRAWLEHLEEAEKRRMELAQSQVMSLMVSMQQIQGSNLSDALSDLFGEPDEEEQKEAPSVTQARSIAGNVKPEWEKLTAFFESVPPPDRCRTIAGEYSQTLRETGATVQDIVGVIDGAAADPNAAVSKLREIMGSNKERIDAAAVRADRGVQEVCDEFATRKWFTIKGDIGGGGLFTMPSIPLPGGGL